jgi:hypothetical protein
MATLLLRAGFDAPAAERLLRRAFVVAAKRAASRTLKRATQSQIASIAGVSRLEVRRLLGSHPSETISTGPESRIQHLLSGWQNDPQFLTRQGRPKPLQFMGSRSEFDELARKYGRDVTKRSLIIQLVRLGLAKEQEGKLKLARNCNSPHRSSAVSADLKFLASQLKGIDFALGKRAYSSRKVFVSLYEKKSVHAARNIALARLDAVLNSLASITVARSRRRRKQKLPAHRLIVSATVAIESEESK